MRHNEALSRASKAYFDGIDAAREWDGKVWNTPHTVLLDDVRDAIADALMEVERETAKRCIEIIKGINPTSAKQAFACLMERPVGERIEDAIRQICAEFGLGGRVMFGQWISVKDRLPEIPDGRGHSDPVLVVYKYYQNPLVAQLHRIEYPDGKRLPVFWVRIHGGFLEPEDVTHWMLLPEPPGEGGVE